jgi:ABC-type transporter Mla MlaB component
MNSPRFRGLHWVSAITLILSGPVAREDVPKLLQRVGVILDRYEGDLIVCDVGNLDEPDAVTLDLLCRLQLTARRLGRRLLLLDAGGGLKDLIDWTGLTEALPCE